MGSAMTLTSQAAEIRALNDEFRRLGPLGWWKFDGLWLFSHGVQAKGVRFMFEAWNLTQRFDAFNANNDPHGEHDFGAFELDGEEVFWKIDYLERGAPFGAADPADNIRTCRIITIMLA